MRIVVMVPVAPELSWGDERWRERALAKGIEVFRVLAGIEVKQEVNIGTLLTALENASDVPGLEAACGTDAVLVIPRSEEERQRVHSGTERLRLSIADQFVS